MAGEFDYLQKIHEDTLKQQNAASGGGEFDYLWDIYKEGVQKTQEPAGFLDTLAESGKSALTATRISGDVITRDFDSNINQLLAEDIQRSRLFKKNPALVQTENAFSDEAQQWEQADGIRESTKALGGMTLEMGKQLVTNPQGVGYLALSNAGNMVPPLVGKAVGKTVGALGGPVGEEIGGTAGEFAGNLAIEAGSEYRTAIDQELQRRGMAPTVVNIQTIRADTAWHDAILDRTMKKAATTAAVDSLVSKGGSWIASGPMRSATEQAVAKLGVNASKEAIEAEANLIYKEMSRAARVMPKVADVGTNILGAGISEGAGQYVADGKVNPADVAEGMLGAVPGAAAKTIGIAREEAANSRHTANHTANMQAERGEIAARGGDLLDQATAAQRVPPIDRDNPPTTRPETPSPRADLGNALPAGEEPAPMDAGQRRALPQDPPSEGRRVERTGGPDTVPDGGNELSPTVTAVTPELSREFVENRSGDLSVMAQRGVEPPSEQGVSSVGDRAGRRVAKAPLPETAGKSQAGGRSGSQQFGQQETGVVNIERFDANLRKIGTARISLLKMPVSQRAEYLAGHPEARLHRLAETYRQRMENLRKRRDALLEAGKRKEAKGVSERMLGMAKHFNKVYRVRTKK